ncbi:MAG: hypothetical protein LBM56_05595 [Burkholderiaceae bacterium]|jgi:hypothetical protein|nr:hypothetical protein [Burkholderiaceae bacterium]
MIRKKVLEDIGISVPDDASRFITRDSTIVFLVPYAEEYGHSIVFTEEEITLELTEGQTEALKAANCFGETGWTII